MKILEYKDGQLIHSNNLEWMKQQPDNSVDLIFGSPPYEAQRTYRELNFNLKGEDWVRWMMDLWAEMHRISKGLVAMVIEGYTEDYRWSATPALLMADLHRAGYRLRKPPLYRRCGTPGTGATDWLRNEYEFILCTSKGRLPWSDNTAMGQHPKFKPGGELSNRLKDGTRINDRSRNIRVRGKSGNIEVKQWKQPEIANPGNIVDVPFEDWFTDWCSEVVDCGAVGGGNMGCKIAHEGDAPFPEILAEFFVRSFCPPAYCHNCGIVLEYYHDYTKLQTMRHGVSDIRMSDREKEILLQEMQNRSIQNPEKNMRLVRGPGAEQQQSESEVLQEDMRVEMDRKKQENDKGPSQDEKGIHSYLHAGASDGDEGGVHYGTPACDGTAHRSGSQVGGGGASQEQDKGRQSDRKFRVNVTGGSQPAQKGGLEGYTVPSLWQGNTTSAQICPCCGEKRVMPGVVLDPFCGTGTTIGVARRFKRRFVGIDIRESEIEKSRRRLENAALRKGLDI